MPSSQDLKIHFESDIRPILESLESKRKWILGLIVLVAILLLGVILVWSTLSSKLIAAILIIVVIIILIILSLYPKYRHKYRAQVVSSIVEIVNPAFKYYPGEGISLDAFLKSGLYEMKPNKVNSNDYIEGQTAGVQFEFATVDARKLRSGANGPAKNVSVFSGVFLHINLFNELHNQIYIVPNRSSVIMGTWSQKNRFMGRGYIISTGHSVFDSLFAVYTYREDYAGLTLNAPLLETIISLSKRFGHEISLSFLNSGCYFSMAGGREFFNPRLIKSGVRFDDINAIHQTVSVALDLVKVLKIASENKS